MNRGSRFAHEFKNWSSGYKTVTGHGYGRRSEYSGSESRGGYKTSKTVTGHDYGRSSEYAGSESRTPVLYVAAANNACTCTSMYMYYPFSFVCSAVGFSA